MSSTGLSVALYNKYTPSCRKTSARRLTGDSLFLRCGASPCPTCRGHVFHGGALLVHVLLWAGAHTALLLSWSRALLATMSIGAWTTPTMNWAPAHTSSVGCRAARHTAIPILGCCCCCCRTAASASAPAFVVACLPALHRTSVIFHRAAVVLDRTAISLHWTAAPPRR